MKRLRVFLAFVLGAASCAAAPGAEVVVAVAANFTAPAQKLALEFEKETGHKAQLAFGSTGRFHAQIANGAPFEVLLAADAETPRRLARLGLAVADSQFTYAIGRLVLWSRQPDLVDGKGEILRTGRFAKLAIADPKLAPYGAAALEAMKRLGVLHQLRPKFVQGESIAQTYQFVASENAQIGFVALSQVFVDGRVGTGSAWIVPQALHPVIRQDAILLAKGAGNPAALAFLAHLRSTKSFDTIRARGYDVCTSQTACGVQRPAER